MKHFRISFIVSIICFGLAFYWGYLDGGIKSGASCVMIALILSVLEISLSFDNAVVNASILKRMDEHWQRLFLTWGLLIAVFGMRLVFPVVIVEFATGIDFVSVTQMAIKEPAVYAQHLTSAHIQIAAFGGMFLLMVFFGFLFNNERELVWLGYIERKFSSFGKLESIEVICSLLILLGMQRFLEPADRLSVLYSGIAGIVLFVIVDSLATLFESEEEGEEVSNVIKRGSMMSFVYLEILDASFSFDGVIGAFAITQDIVTIMLGLAVGAMFVRSLTVFLVRQGTLDQYVFLEHGAHYAIGALAIIMLVSMRHEIPEVVTGVIGAVFITLSIFSSVSYRRKHASLEVVKHS
ncbi:DUF475 domain-containing protein [Methylomonas sp. AM2-LC]|uniref:DUF475 domain-containing protein n=1 Tax=Methylomonas sp. AM2-LC TaxID=3153301 RepID=UPI0032668083